MNFIKRLDFTIAKKCNVFLSPSIDPITKIISWVPLSVLGWFVAVLIVAVLNEQQGLVIFISAAMAVILHFLISEGVLKIGCKKMGLFRRRPYVAYPEEIVPIGGRFSDSSFPSSHVASSAAILAVLSFFYPAFAVIALGIVLIIGFARLHNGMHYPSDVFAGILLGIFYAAVAIVLVKNIL